MEEEVQSRHKRKASPTDERSSRKRRKSVTTPGTECVNCGVLEHQTSACPRRSNYNKHIRLNEVPHAYTAARRSAKIICFHCQGIGHYASRCPQTEERAGTSKELDRMSNWGKEIKHWRSTRESRVGNPYFNKVSNSTDFFTSRRNRGITFRPMGFRALKLIADSDAAAILTMINQNKTGFMEVLNSLINDLDIFVVVIEILCKLCQSPFEESKSKFILDVCNSKFICSLKNYLIELPYPQDKKKNRLYWENQDTFWKNLIVFCEDVVGTSPDTAVKTCKGLIEIVTKACLEGLNQTHEFVLAEEYTLRLQELRQKLISYVDRNKSETAKLAGDAANEEIKPPEDFRELSVVPTREDLLGAQPFLRPNLTEGRYSDVEHYLDVQFRLLREDCFGPIRVGIEQFLANPTQRKYDHIRVYRNVKFVGPYISNLKVGHLIQVDTRSNKYFKRINWAHSKRFLYGSLVLFTKDLFQNCIMATIVDRNNMLLSMGKIPVSIINTDLGLDINSEDTYTMIESEVYFEPYYHVLRALQSPKFGTHLPMQEYIVKVNPSSQRPAYLTDTKDFSIPAIRSCHNDTITEKSMSNINNSSNNVDSINSDNSPLYVPFDESTSYPFDESTSYTDESIPENRNCVKIKFNISKPDTWPTKETLKFNESQYEAYKLALIHEFAVIQGPPGTGKTYVGLKVAETLLRNVESEENKALMLVVCYTNHALDQFLEGISKITKDIIRIGGQSRNKTLDEFNLINIRKIRNIYTPGVAHSRKMKYQLKTSIANFQETLLLLDIFNNGVINYGVIFHMLEVQLLSKYYSFSSDPLCYWLFENNWQYLRSFHECVSEYEAIDIDTEENEFNMRRKEHGNFITIKEDRDAKEAMESFKRTHASFLLLDAKRKLKDMISSYVRQNMSVMKTDIQDLDCKINLFEETLSRDIECYDEARMMLDMELLKHRRVKVLGMTTSGAARNHKLIQAISPKIVIVEEAAEVLEQHIITSLPKDCEHLILIGDHQQLRPSASYMKLVKKYNIGISLFERMITNGMHSRRLDVQHRMRPEIAALISPHIYPQLENHPTVENFGDVLGLEKNVFFFSHEHKEEEITNDGASRSNHKEGDIVLALANYLIQQGYKSDEITILAAYSGQMFYMRKERQKYVHLSDIKITVVDNYQGEESRIILLSLVRNNSENNIGFLGIENRICVALSRAKQGFYMFGNINMLKIKSELWTKIAATLESNGSLGTSLNLKCQNHPEEIISVHNVQDFHKAPEGGCTKKCNYQHSCGHRCVVFCHGYDRKHQGIMKCSKKCERIICDLNHVCPLYCREDCMPCKVYVSKTLPCGHDQRIYCHREPDDPKNKCLTEVDVTLPRCGHKARKVCFMDINDVKCKEKCKMRLEKCGHTCELQCHADKPCSEINYKCLKDCAKANKGCQAKLIDDHSDHQCKKKCFEKCDDCNVQVVQRRSTCKHLERAACSVKIDDKPCGKKCSRIMTCGHYCKRKCFEKCGKCDVMVNKEIPFCKHTINVKCEIDATHDLCNEKCLRTMSCGHLCTGRCGAECIPTRCTLLSTEEIDSPCGHKTKLPCNVYAMFKKGNLNARELLKYCTSPCGVELACQHICSGTCSTCHQGRLHTPCEQTCNQLNICGHLCQEPCNQMCPPCNMPCEIKCAHSRCSRLCGQPCVPCKEKCDRNCPHGMCTKLCSQQCSREACSLPCPLALPCKHRCRGVCGEPCPDICNVCRPEQFPTGFIGEEYEEDDKFILLPDCGHVVELQNMDSIMKGHQETIKMRECPLCRKPVINTNRYKDLINDLIKNKINPIKRKVFGEITSINIKYKELREKVISIYQKYYEDKRTDVCKLRKLYIQYMNYLKYEKKINIPQVETLTIYCCIIEMAIECNTAFVNLKTTTLAQEFQEHMDIVLKVLNIHFNTKSKVKIKISQQQQKDVSNEIRRLNVIVQLAKLLTIAIPVMNEDEVKINVEVAKTSVFTITVFDEEKALESLKILQTTLKASGIVAKLEREMIVKAVGLKAGHWFKCPNGHFYCIGECGGAMQVSKCPECGALIGGTNHSLLSNNSHASEMDGSQYAAYSEQANNMANFLLDM